MIQQYDICYRTRHGSGIGSTLADTGLEMFIQHCIPWLGKQAVKMGRYYGSEFLRQPEYQKKIANRAKKLSQKGVDYAIDALSKDLLNKASDRLRPKDIKKGGKIDYSKCYPMEMYTDISDPTNIFYQRGEGFDIHNAILKIAQKRVL